MLFQTFSIKKKLSIIIFTVCTTVLLFACSILIVHAIIAYKNEKINDLQIIAEIIGANSAAALIFGTPNDASQILALSKANPHIKIAAIYTREGELFAKFIHDSTRIHISQMPEIHSGHKYYRNKLDLFYPIYFEGEFLGTVYIQSDLKDLYAGLTRFGIVVIFVMLVAAIFILLLIKKLGKYISDPILSLAETARQISVNEDFTLRAQRQTSDEIGFLTENFNKMLAQIQERDTAFQSEHTRAEKQTHQLRKELIERRRIENALRYSEQRYRDLFDNAPDIYIILKPDGAIADFNKRGLQSLGYTANDVIGKQITDFIAQEDVFSSEKIINNITTSQKLPQNIESRLLDKNRKIRWVSKEFSFLKNEDGSIQFIRIICRDITDRKKLQDDLGRAQRLETAGRIAGQIAHDFNNLLGPLAAYPALIREDLPPGHPVVEMIDEMEHAAKKIVDINQQLLALGRRGHYAMQPVDINNLIEKVLSSIQLNDIHIDKQFAKDLFLIKGGAAQLSRAFTNLILNAIEATQSNGKIILKTQNIYLDEPLSGYKTINRGEFIRVDISDTGSGIPNEIVNKIFDPFFTTKTTDKMRGSGLGLSVVHGVIEDHNGYITVESKPGTGSLFSIYLPISRDVQLDSAEVTENIKGGKELILVVDDDAIQRKVIGVLLKRIGYKVSKVKSGEKAIAFVKSSKPDLVILDMAMDGIDGTETFRQIKEIHSGQKAIMLSGYAMTQRVQEAINLGAGGFIAKPISFTNLAKTVREELDRPQAHGEIPASTVKAGRVMF